MEISLVANQNAWDGWLKQNSEPNIFAQSWAWGDILLAEGKQVERLAVVDNNEIIAQAQVVYNNLLFGWKYAFSPKGPVLSRESSDASLQLEQALANHFKSRDNIFFRVEPNSRFGVRGSRLEKTIDINPRTTLILGLDNSEEDLLIGMRPKTRYNIRLAERGGLRVSGEKDVENFLRLSEKTAKRHGFKLHGKKHYESVIGSTASHQLSVIHNGQAIATDIFIGFGDAFTYLYGASDYDYHNLMATYLLQWEGIKLAKKMGFKYYDLFGVAPNTKLNNYSFDQKHQYAGVTKFKSGFGGEMKESPGTFDVVISPARYFIYNILRRINRLFR